MKRFLSFLLLFSLLFTPLWSHGESCALCGDNGYLQMPVFGTNELVWVNCPACGDDNVESVTPVPAATPAPVQAADTLRLLDPGAYANGTDQCTVARKGYASFTCTEGYDIDSYLAALTASTGLAITGKYDIGHGFASFYQLTHPQLKGSLYQGTCHATVFYYANSGISLAAAPDGAVQMPDRASVVLPDPRDFAKGEITDFEESFGYISVECEAGFDVEDYIQELRYRYGFDVEAINRNKYYLTYALYNPDIDTELFPISSSTAFNQSTRQVELYYWPEKNKLNLALASYSSIIQLPALSDESRYTSEEFSLPEPPDRANCTVERGDSQCSYFFADSYDWESYIVLLIEKGFHVTDVTKAGSTTTYYLLKPDYGVKRIHNDTSHLSVSYDQSGNELTLAKDAYSLALPKSGQPTPTPKPQNSYSASSSSSRYSSSDSDEDCSYCHGRGTRDCLTCGGDGYVRCGACGGGDQYCSYCDGRGNRRCPSANCHNGKVNCGFCGGSGKK